MLALLDAAALWLIILCLLFLAFMRLSGGLPLPSALLSGLGCMLLRWLHKRFIRPMRLCLKSQRRRYARHLIDQWAALDEETQKSTLCALLRRHGYNVSNPIILPLAPASRALNADRLLACRRKDKAVPLTIIALCPAERNARTWAKRLCITLIDGEDIADLLIKECRAVPEAFLTEKKRRISLKACSALFEQVNPWRSGRYAALALIVYLLRGGWAALFAFVLLLVMTGLGLRQRTLKSE